MPASRPFRPLGRARSAVLAELAGLWDRAAARLVGHGDLPLTQKRLAAESGIPESTLSSWSTGGTLPQDPDQLTAAGTALARWAGQEPPGPRHWAHLLEADKTMRATSSSSGGPGQSIAGLDPFALEVHRPVTLELAGAPLQLLPPYIRRPHDGYLAQVVARAAAGHSAIAVLVGGSSTGKTRACWEALSLLPTGWRLWHPYDPTCPEALLDGLPAVTPRTVIWLNETQHYLSTPGDTGERTAAALTTLLADAKRAPVLIMGTLWPRHWDTLTRERDTRPQARGLLDGTSIPVPAAFTGPALEDLTRAAADDARLAAAAGAADGQVTQYLAGAPVVMDRYRNAPPAARALIHAAMDARRLGHPPALPRGFLEAAATAYLTDTEWDQAGDDWMEQALAWTAADCKGTAGPVTPTRPRPGLARTADGSPTEPGGPAYKLADYLDQHARRHRADQIPPDPFWAAAARHAAPAGLAPLGDAARGRGLYRHAAQLRKNAARHGHPPAAAALVTEMSLIDPSDRRPAAWAAAHGPLDNQAGFARLLQVLGEVGAAEQATALLDRALGDPRGFGLLARTVGHVVEDPDDPRRMARRLDSLRVAGLAGQVAELGGSAAGGTASAPLDDPGSVALLLANLLAAGAAAQFSKLAGRAAAGAPLDDPGGVALLLGILLRARAAGHIIELLSRNPAGHSSLDNPGRIASLLDSLRATGASRQVTELAGRAAAHALLDDPSGVAALLESLQEAGAAARVTELLARNPAANVTLDDLLGVTSLLASLGRAGTAGQVTELASRAAADTALDDPSRVTSLLASLRQAGAVRQLAELTARLPAAGLFDLHPDHGTRAYRFGREPDGRPAPPWRWDMLD